MIGQVLRVAGYRFRTTFHHRWGGYLAVLLLVGLVGGLAMGAISGSRRTQSSFPAFLADSKSSDLEFQPAAPADPSANAYSPALASEIARLPHVKHVASFVALLMAPMGSNGAPVPSQAVSEGQVSMIGSVNGEYFDQDRVPVVQGHLPDPTRADEFATTAKAAKLLGWRLGQVLPMGAFTFQQASSPGFGTPKVQPVFRTTAQLVGIVVLKKEVVHDDIDTFPTAFFTPALTRQLPAGATFFPSYGLRLDHGSRDVSAVEREIIHLLPPGASYTFHVTSVVTAQVERAIKPDSIALGVFGAIAALATLLIAGQAIGRGLRANGEDLDVLRALGADPAMTTADGMIGMLGAVVLGSLIAAGVAVGLSPLSPIGAVRQVDPSPGFMADWLVLTVGLVILLVILGALTITRAYRRAPHRAAPRGRPPLAQPSRIALVAAGSGLPVSAVAGIRFALERGHGRSAAPARSVLLGSILAVLFVVTTLTFGSGLSTLVSHPALYGWNWDYAIVGGDNVPPQARALLDSDRDVASWTGFDFANVQIDRQTVPAVIGNTDAAITPPILIGHGLHADNQIVLGSATLAQLHKRVGDTVVVTYGTPEAAPFYVPPTRLVVVGTSTLPSIGTSGTLHTSMGTGALISPGIEPVALQQALTSPDPTLNGPAIVVVKLRSSVTRSVSLASLRRIADTATKAIKADPNRGSGTYDVLPVQHPAEIVNYKSAGTTPAILASGLAAGAVVALGLTLATSVRRQRRDLALLKTLGFTQRQLAATVVWQASVAAVIGVVVGAPLGIALGRWLWVLFAREIYAVSQPTVPVMSIILVALGSLALASVAAMLPGRSAARTPTALLLRAE